MIWQTTPPSRVDLKGSHEEFYWVRGGFFVRPVMVRVSEGVASEIFDGVRRYWGEIGFTFVADNAPPTIWRHELEQWPWLLELQWAGPVPRPK